MRKIHLNRKSTIHMSYPSNKYLPPRFFHLRDQNIFLLPSDTHFLGEQIPISPSTLRQNRFQAAI